MSRYIEWPWPVGHYVPKTRAPLPPGKNWRNPSERIAELEKALEAATAEMVRGQRDRESLGDTARYLRQQLDEVRTKADPLNETIYAQNAEIAWLRQKVGEQIANEYQGDKS